MTGTSKKKETILDSIKDMLDSSKTDEKAAAKPTAKPTLKTTAKASATAGTVKPSAAKPKAAGPTIQSANQKALAAAAAAKKQEEVLHSKTHQDLINAAYKAAEKLGIAPWVLLRAAGWGHFTDDRGKKYDGPIIDKIEGLDDAQKAALKAILGL